MHHLLSDRNPVWINFSGLTVAGNADPLTFTEHLSRTESIGNIYDRGIKKASALLIYQPCVNKCYLRDV